MRLPRSVSEIDAAWLTEALRAGGVLSNGAVESVAMEMIGEGSGFAGELARLRVGYAPGGGAGPPSMIAKVPTQVPEARTLFTMAGIYESEGAFYRDLGPMVPLRTPRCYFNGMDTAAGDFVLLLEDLAPARVVDQIGSCTRPEAEMIVASLARLHAAFWESPKLAPFEWLSRASSRRDLLPVYPFLWPPAEQRVGDLLSPKVKAMAAGLGSNLGRAIDHLGSPPTTLSHGDYRLDNMFFGVDDAEGGLAVVDWQAVSRLRGPNDLAYFMTGSLTVEDRRAWGGSLIEIYLDSLLEAGVRGYSADECRRDFAIALLQQLSVTVLLMAGSDLSAEGRGPLLAKTMLERTNGIFEDTDFDFFLKE